jgi:hypothetical protein
MMALRSSCIVQSAKCVLKNKCYNILKVKLEKEATIK